MFKLREETKTTIQERDKLRKEMVKFELHIRVHHNSSLKEQLSSPCCSFDFGMGLPCFAFICPFKSSDSHLMQNFVEYIQVISTVCTWSSSLP